MPIAEYLPAMCDLSGLYRSSGMMDTLETVVAAENVVDHDDDRLDSGRLTTRPNYSLQVKMFVMQVVIVVVVDDNCFLLMKCN